MCACRRNRGSRTGTGDRTEILVDVCRFAIRRNYNQRVYSVFIGAETKVRCEISIHNIAIIDILGNLTDGPVR